MMAAVADLFGQTQAAATPADDVDVVRVAVAANLWKLLDYGWPLGLPAPQAGQRVRVPLGKGNKPTLAFVVEPAVAAAQQAPPQRTRLKNVLEVLDPEPQLDATLLKLGQWISQYYLTPLGMTLSAMIPSAVGRHAERTEQVVYLASHHADWKPLRGIRQRKVLDELFEARKQGVEPLTAEQLMQHSGAGRPVLVRLAALGLIRLDSRPLVLPELSAQQQADPFAINDDQAAALARLRQRLGGGFAPMLLHGVTGSGKTEVYVRAIREVAAAGNQAIVLVPEIALATQTLGRLLQRLPRVAVLHSGLTGAQRAFYYQQIRDGHAAVVVGPRSAIFAPCRKLGLIIVDEEHEPSYKQDTSPRYHGRDVAVMRASLAGVPVVLGSATPSLESIYNVRQGRYELLSLPRRVRGLPMPRLHVVHLRQEMQPGKLELIGATLTRRMAAALDKGQQIILLMNRRGYASYVFCPSCEWMMGCENCTRALVFHQATQLAMCHYCDKTAILPEACPACGKKLLLFGYGVQRIESELVRKFPTARVARMDSDTMTSPAQFQQVFGQFAARELDILLGTQMVAKGLDFPGVSLVGVVSADTSLNIPDFRAAERTFQLIVQVAGRAGRSDVPGEVVVQTLAPQEPAIQLAATHDYAGFVECELPNRLSTGLPPYSRLVRFIVRHKELAAAEQSAGQLAGRLRALLPADIRLAGPAPCNVQKVKGLYRFQVLLHCPQAGAVQRATAGKMADICRDLQAEVIADVDPIALL
jgi:primosomal protein N' (replication factor Y)